MGDLRDVGHGELGGELGGFFGGLPSTTAFALLFIGWIESPEVAVDATTSLPFFMGFTGAFLLVYAFFAKRGFVYGLAAALSVWFFAALLITLSGPGFELSLLGCALVSLTTYFGLRRLNLPSLRPTRPSYGLPQRLLRLVISGGIVVVAVLASEVRGPILGGVFSVFPAVFTSTLYTVSRSEGMEFSRGMTTSLMLSAILTVIPYSVTVRYLYPSVGIGYGTVAAYAVAIAIGVVYYRFGRRWMLFSRAG